MIDIFTSEIFTKMDNIKPVSERIEYIIEKTNPVLEDILYHTYSKNIEFRFADIPKYKENVVPVDHGFISMEEALSKIYLFIKNHPKTSPSLTDEKAEKILIQVLESLSKDEARIYAGMIMRKFDNKSVKEKLIRRAFPGLFHEC